jgi:hypothetical protein
MTVTWNRRNPQARMKAEHGSRFSHTSQNAANAIIYFEELMEFVKLNGKSAKLQEINNQVSKHESLIKSELQALAACWYLILYPLWIRLRSAHASKSLDLIDQFTDFSATVQVNVSMEVSRKISNSSFNKFMDLNAPDYKDENTSLKAAVRNLVICNYDCLELNDSILKMLKGASEYMKKLSDTWIREAIPDATIKFPFSNQVKK